ncbi:MAG: glycine oxidase ThiO [Alphaproteobacteria bacterium GM202ARS2]|nr:glycine oxidase ThiO [Alphaproteobacteria bacterium GM202ARS2]
MATRIGIIGGGVQGLSCGWYLAQHGFSVSLFERGVCGSEASGASAGLLASAGDSHAHDDSTFSVLRRHSCALWRDYAAALQRASASTIDYKTTGSLCLAFDGDEHRHWQHHDGGTGVPLDDEALLAREPFVSRDVFSAVYYGEDSHVDGRLVMRALSKAFVRAGGHLHEQATVTEISNKRGRVSGVRLADGTFCACDFVVVAAGAWSGTIDGVAQACVVRPVKGQMLSVDMGDKAYVRHALWCLSSHRDFFDTFYMVPRSDGRLLIGASVEDVGFDKRVTAGALHALLDSAVRVVPALQACPVVATWAGLRPLAYQQTPFIGALDGDPDGLLYACGHYRHGFLLAPYSAQVITDMIVGEVGADKKVAGGVA